MVFNSLQGCYFHCCGCKFGDPSEIHPTFKVKVEQIRKRDQLVFDALRKKSYKVIVMTECKFRKWLSDDEKLRTFVNEHCSHLTDAMHLRDAFQVCLHVFMRISFLV